MRETEILVEQQTPQPVFVCDHAGLVINTFSHLRLYGDSGVAVGGIGCSVVGCGVVVEDLGFSDSGLGFRV